MKAELETTLGALIDRIAVRFPRQSRAHIGEIARSEYDALADRPIRMYVSNLVEHGTRTRLRQEAALPVSRGPSTLVTPGAAPSSR